jgi:hypothetical protein
MPGGIGDAKRRQFIHTIEPPLPSRMLPAALATHHVLGAKSRIIIRRRDTQCSYTASTCGATMESNKKHGDISDFHVGPELWSRYAAVTNEVEFVAV